MTIENVSQAAEAAKVLAKQFRTIIEVGEFLGSIASLDQRAAEAGAAAKKASDAADAQQARLAEVSKELAALQASFDSIKANAAQAVKDAQAKADSIVGDARSLAAKEIEEAQKERAEIDAETEKAEAEHEKKMADFAVAESDAQARLEAINGEIDALKKRIGG